MTCNLKSEDDDNVIFLGGDTTDDDSMQQNLSEFGNISQEIMENQNFKGGKNEMRIPIKNMSKNICKISQKAHVSASVIDVLLNLDV